MSIATGGFGGPALGAMGWSAPLNSGLANKIAKFIDKTQMDFENKSELVFNNKTNMSFVGKGEVVLNNKTNQDFDDC